MPDEPANFPSIEFTTEQAAYFTTYMTSNLADFPAIEPAPGLTTDQTVEFTIDSTVILVNESIVDRKLTSQLNKQCASTKT